MTPAYDSFLTLLHRRHSCRAFLPDAVPGDTVTAILTAAQRVASWNNTQPWMLTITRPGETERLRGVMTQAAQAAPPGPDLPFPERYEGIYKERRSVCGWQLYDAVGVQKGDRAASARQGMENFRFFGAPHLAVVTSPADLGPYGAVDVGAYVMGFMLAAEALGVATIAQAALAPFADVLRRELDLPEDRLVVCGIAFGFEDRDHPANSYRTTRADLDEVVTWRG
ncbi:nitroreductase [Anianabacter salinae]|uniref:nitroreductase n=1 Tax=Anianabacter salinae TaxID=2851023 RepID=UPI00225E5B65|nr:nitroreductase [Anianabacter salinae]MBV0913908.1 nitroreductase [Anianabacter salinae]